MEFSDPPLRQTVNCSYSEFTTEINRTRKSGGLAFYSFMLRSVQCEYTSSRSLHSVHHEDYSRLGYEAVWTVKCLTDITSCVSFFRFLLYFIPLSSSLRGPWHMTPLPTAGPWYRPLFPCNWNQLFPQTCSCSTTRKVKAASSSETPVKLQSSTDSMSCDRLSHAHSVHIKFSLWSSWVLDR
jgi:hypothetical protein